MAPQAPFAAASQSCYSELVDRIDQVFAPAPPLAGGSSAAAIPSKATNIPCLAAGTFCVTIGGVAHPVANVLHRDGVPPSIGNNVQTINMTICRTVTTGEFLQTGYIRFPFFLPENSPSVQNFIPTIDYGVTNQGELIGHKKLGAEWTPRIIALTVSDGVSGTPYPIIVKIPGIQQNAHCQFGTGAVVLPGHSQRTKNLSCFPHKLQTFDSAHEARAHALAALHSDDLTRNTVTDPVTKAVTLLTPFDRGHPLVEFSWVNEEERGKAPDLNPCFGYDGALSEQEYRVRLNHALMTRAASYAIPAAAEAPGNQIELSIGDLAHAKAVCETMLRSRHPTPMDVPYTVYMQLQVTVVSPGAGGVIRNICELARGAGSAQF